MLEEEGLETVDEKPDFASAVPRPSGPSQTPCPICGHGHSSELDRLEHWLLESGGLRRSTDLGEKGLPVTRPGGMDPRQSSPCLHRFPRDAPVAEGAL